MSSRPEVVRALAERGGSSSADEVEHFYAQRVADYARVLALVFGGLYVIGFGVSFLLIPDQVIAFHLHPAKLANLAFALAALAIYLVARRPNAPRALVAVSDVLLPVGTMLVVGAVSLTAPPGHGIFFMPLLLAALLLVVRAALVPSDPRRTAVVGVLTAFPVVGAAWMLARTDTGLRAPVTPGIVAIACAVWCGALLGCTVQVSRVIYGLRREIRDVKRLGQYVLGDLIGEGGMGRVYKAEHALLRRPTAVKVLLPERAGRDAIARFEREVMQTARLTHPNTIAVYDYGRTADGLFYYAMEYLDGLSLEDLVRRFGPQSPGRVVHILLQMTGALAEAHSLGLIHRDIKPANVLFCERGGLPDAVKLVDFGLVKSLEPQGGPALTRADAITGTPHYLAPESIADPATIDHRVDLYGVGGVAYFLLTGRPPFEGRSVLEVCGHHLHTAPVPPSELAAMPPELDALILKCLAKDPAARPADAQQLHDELVACARCAPWTPGEARRFWRELKSASAPT